MDIMDSIRRLLQWIVGFLTDTDMFDNLSTQVNGGLINIGDAVKATGITLCVLFFLIDFFQKSLHLQWVTWENVMMFFMKLFFARIMLNNAGLLLSMIHNGFSSIIEATGLPSSIGHGIFPVYFPGSDVGYFLNSGSPEYNNAIATNPDTSLSLMAGFTNIGITIIGLIMRVVFCIAAIMIIARMFELLVYTVIAPIPLATLSCEGLQDIGKGFLKSYAAVCLQAVVIVIMIVVFSTLMNGTNRSLLHLDSIDQSWVSLLMTFIFGAGIMQSGSWAKKFCGAM